MKKLISLIAVIAISPLVSFGQAASVSFGSQLGLGGGLFTNVNTISLVDDSFNVLGSAISVGNDFQGTYGYANATQSLSNVSFSGTPYLALTTASGLTAYIQSSAWSSLSSALPPTSAPAAPSTYNISIGGSTSAADLTLINAVAADGAGFQGTGVSISVVPEPSTYALIAGFAAFLFVAIRRRK